MLLSVPDFLQKPELRANALKMAKSKIDVELDSGKKTNVDVVAKLVMGEKFNPFIDHGGFTYVTWRESFSSIPFLYWIWLLEWPVSSTLYCYMCRILKQSTVVGIFSGASTQVVGCLVSYERHTWMIM